MAQWEGARSRPNRVEGLVSIRTKKKSHCGKLWERKNCLHTHNSQVMAMAPTPRGYPELEQYKDDTTEEWLGDPHHQGEEGLVGFHGIHWLVISFYFSSRDQRFCTFSGLRKGGPSTWVKSSNLSITQGAMWRSHEHTTWRYRMLLCATWHMKLRLPTEQPACLRAVASPVPWCHGPVRTWMQVDLSQGPRTASPSARWGPVPYHASTAQRHWVATSTEPPGGSAWTRSGLAPNLGSPSQSAQTVPREHPPCHTVALAW